jgi:uncharacterized protein (TIGR00725 family)
MAKSNASFSYTYQLCVSGAAKGESVETGRDMAIAAGRAVAETGNMLMTGATIGLPNYAAQGAKEAGGLSVGISPAATKVAHVKKYRLPTAYYDAIIYTGLNYVGRDSLLIASADAIVSIGGRLGTLHEFTIAAEMGKPMGFLTGAGGISTEIDDILAVAKPLPPDFEIIFDDNPTRLVKRLVEILDRRNDDNIDIYR